MPRHLPTLKSSGLSLTMPVNERLPAVGFC
ncbi:hypothetical protein RHECNPAF_3500057 [Rhizobium etli CNPAF512]|nr:hypothetical protein RHECNPAF_3500057 [Rhizobium etli CNPAF512]